MSEKFTTRSKEDSEEQKDEFVFRVFMPNNENGRELKNRLISHAKLHNDNKVWKTVKHGMDLIEESDEAMKINHENRIRHLEEEIADLKSQDKEKDSKDVKTFGGENDE